MCGRMVALQPAVTASQRGDLTVCGRAERLLHAPDGGGSNPRSAVAPTRYNAGDLVWVLRLLSDDAWPSIAIRSDVT